MNLTLIPIWGRPEGALSVSGDKLTRYGVEYDFSAVPEGGEGWPAPPEPGEDHVFVGPIRRVDGVIQATLLVHLGETAALDQPDVPWTVNVLDGSVAVPIVRIPEPEVEEDVE